MKNGHIIEKDSLTIRNGRVFIFENNSLHDLPAYELAAIVYNDSIIKTNDYAMNYVHSGKFKTAKPSFGLYHIGYPNSVPDSIATSTSHYFLNKKGEGYITGGMGFNSNNFAFSPHWCAFGQLKFSGLPILIAYEYSKRLIETEIAFVGRSYTQYQTIGIGYQLQGKSILATHYRASTATYLKANLSWGESKFRYWDFFDQGRWNAAKLMCTSVAIQCTSINAFTAFSVEFGAGYAVRFDSKYGQNSNLLALNIGVKMGLSNRFSTTF